MLHKMFSVRDSKAETFHPPIYVKTHGEAERNFHATVNNEETTIGRYPDDYDLYYIGEYDDQTGKIKSETPQHIVKAVQLKTKKLS